MPRNSMEILTESMFYCLMALSKRPMCGIDIAAWITDRTCGRVSLGPATLYTVLGKFEKEGYIRTSDEQLNKINNTIYSEYYNGLEFNVSKDNKANEFIDRMQSENPVLPMITSCSPGWVRYSEMYYPELLNHLSTCKSPHQMQTLQLKWQTLADMFSQSHPRKLPLAILTQQVFTQMTRCSTTHPMQCLQQAKRK